MIKQISESVTAGFVYRGVIEKDNQEIYQYGFELLISKIIHIVTAMIIGIAFGQILEISLFLIAYIPLRQYSGGYHAPNHIRCLLVSIGIIIGVCVAMKLYNMSTTPIMWNLIISILITLILAPVADANKPLDASERKVYKRRTKLILFILTVVTVLLIVVELHIGRWSCLCRLYVLLHC